MNSHADADFWRLFARLPGDVRKQSYKAFKQFQRDPFHPGLNFEEVNKRTGLWLARINDQYRVLGYREGSEIHWFWVGTHREYDKLIGRR